MSRQPPTTSGPVILHIFLKGIRGASYYMRTRRHLSIGASTQLVVLFRKVASVVGHSQAVCRKSPCLLYICLANMEVQKLEVPSGSLLASPSPQFHRRIIHQRSALELCEASYSAGWLGRRSSARSSEKHGPALKLDCSSVTFVGCSSPLILSIIRVETIWRPG